MSDCFEQLCRVNGIDTEKVGLVAFDIFDTILYRKVSPEHVHHIWANKLIKKYGLKLPADKVVKYKFESGRQAKVKNIIVGKDREYHYSSMAAILQRRLGINEPGDTFCNVCLALEIETEKEVTFVPDSVRELIAEVRSRVRKVVCISDFYLPKSVLVELLSFHNLQFDGTFVSCDYLLQKKTGRLYVAVSRELGVAPENILMIGDTIESDVLKAKENGYQAIHLENTAQYDFYKQFEDSLNQARNEYRDFMKSDEVVKRTKPYSHVAFLMTIFIKRLYEQLVDDGCADVLFMSREGEFFKKLFDKYQEQELSKEKQIRTHYFYVSRRATIVPSIYRIEKKSFHEIYKNYPSMKPIDFLRNLGLDTDIELLNTFSFDAQKTIDGFPESKEYDEILGNPIFQEKCLGEAESQRKMFIKYLDDMGIDYRNKGLYLVDVGYSGTSQNNINAIFKGEVRIHGYYMISYAEKDSCNEVSSKTGIVYDTATGSRKNAFTYNSSVIEMLSLASHCGVEGYRIENEKIVPVFCENEQELICYRDVIQHLQKTIIDEMSNIVHMLNRGYIDENYYYKDFLKQYKRFIYNPTIDEMNEYLTIPFVDNFAVYRKYMPDQVRSSHKTFSVRGFITIIKTKGQCLKDQDTHWIAVALYKLDMRCANPVMLFFSGFTMKMFDVMKARAWRRKGIKQ